MSIENVENTFKNRLSFEFNRTGSYSIYDLFDIKDCITCTSKILTLSNLKINNMRDLIEEATPSIYSTVSWLEKHLIFKEDVEFFKAKGVNPLYFLDDTIDFWIKLYFYEAIIREKEQIPGDCKDENYMLRFKFKFDDFTKDVNILTDIKSHINEELKEKSRVLDFFDTTFVKIEIGYYILAPDDEEDGKEEDESVLYR